MPVRFFEQKKQKWLAEGEGFEPPFRVYRKAVFKTAAFNHSAIPPGMNYFNLKETS